LYFLKLITLQKFGLEFLLLSITLQ